MTSTIQDKFEKKPLKSSRTIQSILVGSVMALLTLTVRHFDLPEWLMWLQAPETLEGASALVVLIFARLIHLKIDDNKKVSDLVDGIIEGISKELPEDDAKEVQKLSEDQKPSEDQNDKVQG